MSEIKIIPSYQINKLKWDNCIATNSNGLIYATSLYLDTMANKWFGLIINDYETIFPIPLKVKLGIRYTYMPAFIQQLGFIGNNANITSEVIEVIFKFIKYGSPYINFSNKDFAIKNNCKSLSNFIIDLSNNYDGIKNNYKKTIDYSLAKAAKFNLQYVVEENGTTAFNLYKEYNQHNMKHVQDIDYKKILQLLQSLKNNGQVVVRKAINTSLELLSITLLLKDTKRYYNLINYTTELGRKTEANYFLYDNILKEFSNQPMLFDFEGSDLPGVKSFYEKFGAVNQPYFHWHFNHLPTLLKWFKS